MSAPRERPILFSGPMVRALLDGRKTQTRRICKPAIDGEFPARSVHPDGAGTGWIAWWGDPITAAESARMYPGAEGFRCTYGQPGDRLWVKEKFTPLPMQAPTDGPSRWLIQYAEGCQRECDAPAGYNPMLYNYERWTSSLFMPRWASRITLEVTGVRVERLQAISEADALAEGVTDCYRITDPVSGEINRDAVEAYADLWESINGPGSWDANPWVWVVSFRRIAEEWLAADTNDEEFEVTK